MTEQNLSVEPEDNFQENLSNGAELENSLPIEASNANLVESNSTCSKYNGNDKKVAERPKFVWAFGRVTIRMPDECISREYQNAVNKLDTRGLTDSQVMYQVLKKPENRYLVRKLCWVLQISKISAYILRPVELSDYDLLVESINPAISTPEGSPLIDIVIGTRGPIADLSVCNCLPLPIVIYDQIFSFNISEFIDKIVSDMIEKSKSEGTLKAEDEKALRDAVRELFTRVVLSSTDNLGATPAHIAMNFAMTYPPLFRSLKAAYDSGKSLESIDAFPASVSTQDRLLFDVVLTLRDPETQGIYQESIRVDVTCEFPFIVSGPRQVLAHI